MSDKNLSLRRPDSKLARDRLRTAESDPRVADLLARMRASVPHGSDPAPYLMGCLAHFFDGLAAGDRYALERAADPDWARATEALCMLVGGSRDAFRGGQMGAAGQHSSPQPTATYALVGPVRWGHRGSLRFVDGPCVIEIRRIPALPRSKSWRLTIGGYGDGVILEHFPRRRDAVDFADAYLAALCVREDGERCD